jgi:predicted nucleic acid-binding protein
MWENELRPGGVVGLDANVFLYHFTGRSRRATELLGRIEAGDFAGVTTRETLIEVLHRLMVFEAMAMGLAGGNNPARSLKRNPELVRSLSRYARDAAAIPAMGVRILPPLEDPIRESQPFRARYGLLSNDSLLAATLAVRGIPMLATADRDFLRVDELQVLLLDDIA